MKIIKTETIFARRGFACVNYTLELPDQTTVQTDVITHPGVVAIVPVKEDGQIVLIEQYRASAQKKLIEIPAGGLEPGEDPHAAAERELQEEAGYFPGKLEAIGGFFVSPGLTEEYIHLFLARDLRPSKLAPDSDEFIAVKETPLPEALAMINDSRIEDAKTIIGIFRAAALLR